MKFASIYLSNYIGIYNGMGIYDIHIDMTKCKNRITIIRGDNGSGKSTLSKAMSLFPDPNDAFIPGMAARKEIILIDGETFYKLVFVHGVKSNGDREVTKAYITKTFGNNVVELNENGNVSSYKDILYSHHCLCRPLLKLAPYIHVHGTYKRYLFPDILYSHRFPVRPAHCFCRRCSPPPAREALPSFHAPWNCPGQAGWHRACRL